VQFRAGWRLGAVPGTPNQQYFEGSAHRHAHRGRKRQHAAPGDEEPAHKRHAVRFFLALRHALDLNRIAMRKGRCLAQAVVLGCLIAGDDRRCFRAWIGRDGRCRVRETYLRVRDLAGEMRGQQPRAAQLLIGDDGKGLRIEKLAEAACRCRMLPHGDRDFRAR
jgi:hypothetical protein